MKKVKNIISFKIGNSLMNVLYDIAKKYEKGFDNTKKKGFSVMYIKCTKSEFQNLVKSAKEKYRSHIKLEIQNKHNEIFELYKELENI